MIWYCLYVQVDDDSSKQREGTSGAEDKKEGTSADVCVEDKKEETTSEAAEDVRVAAEGGNMYILIETINKQIIFNLLLFKQKLPEEVAEQLIINFMNLNLNSNNKI